jgi:broad specificity phosphatase PhoE
MTTILLARHGETDWNLQQRWQGHTDTPLNDTGREQARALGEELAGERIDAVFSSDLIRAHETARLVAAPRKLSVTVLRDLRERHFGSVEGLTTDEVIARYPDIRDLQADDGESREEMVERVLSVIRRIAETHPEGSVLVVSHGGPMRAVLTHCGIDGVDRIQNCHVVRIEVVDGRLRGVD